MAFTEKVEKEIPLRAKLDYKHTCCTLFFTIPKLIGQEFRFTVEAISAAIRYDVNYGGYLLLH